MSEHWTVIAQSDGKRLERPFFYGEVPYGWVVNGKLPAELQTKIKAHAIPLKSGGWRITSRLKARKYLNNVKVKVQGEVIMLMVPCDETEGGWFSSPILVADLDKQPGVILREAGEAQKQKNYLIQRMKECAYMAVTGSDDLR